MPPTLQKASEPLPIVIKQGADFRLALCIIERDENGDAVVVDTSGWSVKMQVRKVASQDSPVLMEASTDNGRVVVGIQGGPGEQVNIDMKVPASVTKLIYDFGEGGYDLRVTSGIGNVDFIIEGPALLQPAYTW